MMKDSGLLYLRLLYLFPSIPCSLPANVSEPCFVLVGTLFYSCGNFYFVVLRQNVGAGFGHSSTADGHLAVNVKKKACKISNLNPP